MPSMQEYARIISSVSAGKRGNYSELKMPTIWTDGLLEEMSKQ